SLPCDSAESSLPFTRSRCQGKVESSYSQQSRKFRFSMAASKSQGKLRRRPPSKRALRRETGRRQRSWLGQNRRKVSWAINNPGGPSGRLEGFPGWDAFEFWANSEPEAVHPCGGTSMLDRGFFLSL